MEQPRDNETERTGAPGPGALYLCATPIGNLEDMTYRAVRVLREADLIAAEDTRHTRGLLAHFDIHTPLTSYHEHNKLEKGPRLIERMLAGARIACVSDAGLPGIADPGSHLAQLAIEAGIPVTPLPGANAALSALIASGLDTTRFAFVGFLPRTLPKRRERLAEIRNHRETLLFYEAPHHLTATLTAIAEALGDREAVIGREITKKFEEFRRGKLSALRAHFAENEPRGEFVIVVAGADDAPAGGETVPADPVRTVTDLMAQGLAKKDAIREAARRLNLSRREVYQRVLAQEQAPD
ncbi:MAG: 16S rRNA (cytidine(1402)-2'-O)-methyltransferase [Schwartzia sp.]|nr:16S rRNA (cytidine(1402)-2'-O)-methyltransferase [Schwartzia sp. (in: firmicutes)]